MDQLLYLAKTIRCLQSLSPVLHMAQTFHICGHPSKTMGRGLVLFDQRINDTALIADQCAQLGLGYITDRLSRRRSLCSEG